MNDGRQSVFPSASNSPNTKDLLRFEAQKKSSGTALILCWMLGSFGAHRFYLERTGSATVMLIITLLSIPLTFIVIGFFGLFIIAVWVLFDLFSVSRWAREYNSTLLATILAEQG